MVVPDSQLLRRLNGHMMVQYKRCLCAARALRQIVPLYIVYNTFAVKNTSLPA